MSDSSRLQPGAVIGSKYLLESGIARGGMGAVWRARHIELGVSVAIKFIDGVGITPLVEARFAREAQAAAALRHPNIVDVRDYGVDAGLPYLVMELLQGQDLGQRLKQLRRLSLPATAAIIGQIARALRGAHEAGIVHRDLKPANVFLARVDDEEVVKLLDFGIAKNTLAAPVGENTATGELIGSPPYMSPEQIRGVKDIDARSDLWALGVIAFRCLTGRLPFDGNAVGLIIGQILADPIPTATSVAPDLPLEVDAFFARALSRDREGRFSSARELATALAALASATPGPESWSRTRSEADGGRWSAPPTSSTPPVTAAPSDPRLLAMAVSSTGEGGPTGADFRLTTATPPSTNAAVVGATGTETLASALPRVNRRVVGVVAAASIVVVAVTVGLVLRPDSSVTPTSEASSAEASSRASSTTVAQEPPQVSAVGGPAESAAAPASTARVAAGAGAARPVEGGASVHVSRAAPPAPPVSPKPSVRAVPDKTGPGKASLPPLGF